MSEKCLSLDYFKGLGWEIITYDSNNIRKWQARLNIENAFLSIHLTALPLLSNTSIIEVFGKISEDNVRRSFFSGTVRFITVEEFETFFKLILPLRSPKVDNKSV